MATNVPVTLDTLIVIKVLFQGQNKKFKVPLRDLGAQVLPDKLRMLLQLHPDEEVVFERYSDSAGAYVTLESNKPQVYKTLFRAAKAKLKLRLRASIVGEDSEAPSNPPSEPLSAHHESLAPPTSTSMMTGHRVAQASPVIARTPNSLPSTYNTKTSPVILSPTYRKPEVETAQASPVSPPTSSGLDAEDEAPLPQPFTARQSYFHKLAQPLHSADLAFRPKESGNQQCSWVVFCNHCNRSMDEEHFHCSICDQGDYDLCPACVEAGVHCPGSGHWMVKRFVKNGCVVNSTTERVGPKLIPQNDQEMPGAFTDEKQPVPYEAEQPTRTCNCCVKVLSEKEFVTCGTCDDYDLCLDCHINNKHGHHPGHAFKAATPDTVLPALADFLCNAGRNVRHSAVCDGCEKFIYGVRHKCLNCPDWDFCSECIKNAKFIHPRHRFVPIYEPLAEPVTSAVRHYGIYCDGPLCKDRENLSYIEGVRYKCAVCHDTDFCANCEAIPSNRHNRTHPLIKFKTPVRSVSVTTMSEDKHGLPTTRLGDQPARKSTATETTPVAPSSNAATQVHTIVDMKPVEEVHPKITKEKIEIRDLLAEPVQEKIAVSNHFTVPPVPAQPANAVPITRADTTPSDDLDAHFIRDTIVDGSQIGAGMKFIQVWTLRNPGPNPWPAGCSVRHVGGDNMLNIDNTRPLSQSELSNASESNVVGRAVEPGEEISFRILMKAPSREGTAISYWRLKTAEGTPFGHRLWCDIQVIHPTAPLAAPTSQSAAVTVPTAEDIPLVAEEAAESCSVSGNATNMTSHERWHQAKLDRLRMMQSYRNRESKASSSARPGPVSEEVRERVRKRMLAFGESRANEHEEQSQLLNSLEREKMQRIMKVRKAAVERLLDNRRKEQENLLAAQQEKDSDAAKALERAVEHETAELPVEEKPVQAQSQSGMIFPRLDKESPASSTHEAANTDAPEVTSGSAIAAPPSEQQSEPDLFEDAESVEVLSLSSDDEGFMTDEEYDILDASDEEAT